MSKRERVPNSGRSNLNSARSNPAVSSRMGSARSVDTISTTRREQLQNPLEVFRPYSPEITVADSHINRPPILPKNRFLTNPPMDPTLGVTKQRKKSICPDGFIEKNLAPNWFETIDQGSALLDYETKIQYCRDFADRNRDRLWKFDHEFRGLTPRGVVNHMISNEGMLARMKKYDRSEKALSLSSSEQFKAACNDDQCSTSKSIIKTDPYLMSYDTPRNVRTMKMTNLMTNSNGDGTAGDILQYGRKNQRGYKHTTGFGNFSNFNGLIQLNKNCSLNR
jgi:hypothetical protein